MIRYENHCCGCAVSGYPCVGNTCPNINVPVYYCDRCNDGAQADYDVEGEHLCQEHIREYIKDVFKDLTISEQAEILNISLNRLEN